MKKAAIVAAVLLGIGGVLLFLVVRSIDPRELIDPQLVIASEQLGRPVTLGELDLAVFPPAIHASNLRVGGLTPEQPALLEVDALRVTLSVLPLLLGQVVLRSLELEAPRIQLDVDEGGMPVPPELAPSGDESGSMPGGSSADEGEAEDADDGGEGITLAVQGIEIHNGQLEAGEWKVTNLEITGWLSLDRSAELRFSADLPGLLALRDGELVLEGLGGESLNGQVEFALEALQLDALDERLKLEQGMAGELAGPVSFAFKDSELVGAQLDLRGSAIAISQDDFDLEGDLDFDAELGGLWKLDLTQARLRVGETLRKPVGVETSLSGKLGKEASVKALRDVLVKFGANQLELALDLASKPMRVQVKPGKLELAGLNDLLSEQVPKLGGRLEFALWEITPDPLEVSGKVTLAGVQVVLPEGSVTANGSVSAEGRTLRTGGIKLRVAEQEMSLSGDFDMASQQVNLRGQIEGADVHALGTALAGSGDLSGTLAAQFSFSGPPDIQVGGGTASFAIVDGKLKGFSLLKQLLGDLAALPMLIAQFKGKDLSRYQEEEFKSLSGDVRLRSGRLYTENLTLEYRHSTALLHGSVGVIDGTLDLGGKLTINEEVDAAISGEARGERQVFLIEGITGTVSEPRVHIDQRTLAAIAASYAGGSEVKRKLEETLGTKGAEAVEDLLNQMLRRGGKR